MKRHALPASKQASGRRVPERGFVHHSLRTYLVQMGVTGLGVVLAVLTMRFLGPEGKGMLSLLVLIPVLTVVFGRSGIGPSLVYHSSRVPKGRLITKGLRLTLIIGSVATLAGAAIVFWQRNAFFRGIPPALLAVMCALAFVYFFYDLVPHLFLTLGLIDLRNLVILVSPAANIAFFLLFVVVLKKRLPGAVAAWALAVIIPVAAGLAWFSRRRVPEDRSPDPRLGGRILSYGLKSHPGTIMELLNYRADFLIISLFSGPAAVGLYACAVNMAEVVWKLPEAVTVVLLPKASSLPPKAARELTAKVSRVALGAVAVLFLVLAAFRRPLIVALFGRAFLPSATPFLILVPGFIAFSLWRVLAYGLLAQGFPQTYSLSAGLSFLIMLAGDLILIPRIGIVGAAWASTAAYILATLGMVIVYMRKTGATLAGLALPRRADWSTLGQALGLGTRGEGSARAGRDEKA